MGVSERAVRKIEQCAFDKIRNHPVMKQFWREWQGGGIEEADLGSERQLSQSEIAAVFALARTSEERKVIRSVIALIDR
jgi:hypothetical protein